MISPKQYECPVCGHVDKISTNHYGEIYSPCRKCGSSQPLRCIEPEAKFERPIIKTILHYYYFNLDMPTIGTSSYDPIPPALDRYRKLEEVLSKTKKKFSALIPEPHKTFQKFKDLDGKEVHLYSDWVTENQWASVEGLRIFDWQEAIYPNKKIKEGYFLEITEEMTDLREKHGLL